MKLKDKIIHLLGGYTQREYEVASGKGYEEAATEIKKYADYLYGKDTDTWCKYLYKFICSRLESSGQG